MDIVCLIYGLSFLGMGLAILIRYDYGSRLELSHLLWLLAAFAFSHGLREWMDLWRVVRGDARALAVSRPVTLLGSYLFLLEFGRRLVRVSLLPTARARAAAWLLAGWIHLPVLAGIVAGTATAGGGEPAMELWSRYLAGLPGSALTGWGFFAYGRRHRDGILAGASRVRLAFHLAAGSFMVYGVLGGLIGPRASWFPASVLNQDSFRAELHVPVQLLRALCAVLASTSVSFLLKVFHLEGVKRLHGSEERLRRVIDHAPNGIMVVGRDGKVRMVNPAFSRITGFAAEETVGRSPRLLKSGRHPAEFYARLWHALEAEGEWQGEIWNRRRDGEIYPEWLSITAARDGHGQITDYVGIFSDISQRKELEQDLERMAFYDPLTGLPNRILFHERLRQALRDVKRYGGFLVAVLYLDLDLFKQVNDRYGHELGDALLEEAAKRLSAVVREADTVARLGGDEFGVVLTHIADAEAAAAVAAKIIGILGEPFILYGRRCQIGTSIGIALAPSHGCDVKALIATADHAMYQAKRGGRNRYRVAAGTVGQEVLDSQRVQLLARVAALTRNCSSGRDPVSVAADLMALVAALEAHFLIEESLLREAGFSGWRERAEACKQLVAGWKVQASAAATAEPPALLSTLHQFEKMIQGLEPVEGGAGRPVPTAEAPPQLEWSDVLTVGNDEVDRQHQDLVGRLRDLYDLAGRAPHSRDFLDALRALAAVVGDHFRDEERLFAGRDDPEAARHRLAHTSLLNAFATAVADLERGRVTALGLVRGFLAPWLLDHILETDCPHLRGL